MFLTVLGEVDRLIDNLEGDFLLLGLLEGREIDLDGDRNGADPSYFDQSYLGPYLCQDPSIH